MLHVLSKEVVNRWRGIVDDHKAYLDKLNEVETWLKPLEISMKEFRESNDMAIKSAKLEALLSEREDAPHKLNNLSTKAEKLYPDTSAPGREQIRNEIRELRERYILSILNN